jgi:hypothetical protein
MIILYTYVEIIYKGIKDKKRHPRYLFEGGGSEHDKLLGGGRRIGKFFDPAL